MLTTFDGRWRRHDGFGLAAIAVVIIAAIAVGYFAARPGMKDAHPLEVQRPLNPLR